VKFLGELIVWFGVPFLCMWVLGAIFGEESWGITIGFIIGLIAAWHIIDSRNKSEKEKRNLEIVKRNQRWGVSDFGQSGEGFVVNYHYGHNGLDHYMRMYAKVDHLLGNLAVSDIGIRFECPTTRTKQKFTVLWSDVSGVSYPISGFVSKPNAGFQVDTSKHGMLIFSADEASTITNQMNARLAQFRGKVEQQELLIESQIRSRNLDSIPPSKFESLVSQLFRSMGYQVIQVGRTGDEGVDIVCRDQYNQEIIVQCKRYKGKVGAPTIRDFYGALEHRKSFRGFVVTTGEFTEPAIKWAAGKPIELIDRTRLADLLDKYQPAVSEGKKQQSTQQSFWG
jgi:HJR/Mrr/RecB family endonuclease